MIVSYAKAKRACEILDIQLEDLDKFKVVEAYRERAKTAHPDKGGSIEEFGRVDWAKHALFSYLEKNSAPPPAHEMEKCHACAGKGHVMSSRGLGTGLRRQCISCRGTGDANLDLDKTTEGL